MTYLTGFTWTMNNEELELSRLKKKGKSMNVSNKTVRIWRKNLKQGYRFFEPHNAKQLAPRSMREAYGHRLSEQINNVNLELNESKKAYIILAILLIILAVMKWL